MKSLKRFFTAFLCLLSLGASSSEVVDTTRVYPLDGVVVGGNRSRNGLERMPPVRGAVIYSGKKSEVIRVGNINADLTTNNARQIFGRVPGVTIWENDGSGIQLGISTRGLNPNRSWEFNVRQNG